LQQQSGGLFDDLRRKVRPKNSDKTSPRLGELRPPPEDAEEAGEIDGAGVRRAGADPLA
jgi:hypothetical protein